jgi:hypothetical protein
VPEATFLGATEAGCRMPSLRERQTSDGHYIPVGEKRNAKNFTPAGRRKRAGVCLLVSGA